MPELDDTVPQRGNHDLVNRSIRAVIWSYAGGIGRIIAQLLIQVWLARVLGPAVFGQFAAVLVVIGFGWLVADCGFGAALIQKKELSDGDVGFALGWILVLSLISVTSVVALAPYLAQMIGDTSLTAPFMACGPVIALQAISNLSVSLMRRNLDAKRDQIIHVLAYVIGFGVVAVGLAKLEMGVWSLVIGFLVQTLIILLASYWLIRHTLRPTLRGDVQLGIFGLGVLGTNLANQAIVSVDRFLIGRIWGIPTLGNYSAASNLSQVPIGLLVNSFQTVVFSSASQIQDDPVRLRQGYSAILTLASLVTFPLGVGLALKADFIVHLLYGNKWSEASPLFAAFCVALPFSALLAISGPVLWAVGAVSKEFRVQLLVVAALIGGLVLLSGQPISVAVWFITLVYFLRFVLIYLGLASCIQLRHRDAIHAIGGGLLLAAVVLAVDVVTGLAIPAPDHGEIGWVSMQIVLMGVACIATVRTAPTQLLGATLSQQLSERASDSKSVRLLCNLLALKQNSA
ncbi:MAG: lipopolysaccharide biosynthesis protein [Rhodoferax sp.]|nr:lipopolysaccharide biosynthesis protein [Rhodoferax sp.]